MGNHNLPRMRFIGFVLVLCLLCQSCVSSATVIAFGDAEKTKEIKKFENKFNCNFEAVISIHLYEQNEFKKYRFGKITGPIDLLSAIYYNIQYHPIGLSLVGNFYYGFIGFFIFAFPIPAEEQLSGLKDDGINKCRQSYFIQSYKSKKELEQEEINFYKILAYYGKDADTSQDEKRFTEFQTELLKNKSQIQVYRKDNYFYRYLYYPGGKKTFAAQYKKYLYLHSD